MLLGGQRVLLIGVRLYLETVLSDYGHALGVHSGLELPFAESLTGLYYFDPLLNFAPVFLMEKLAHLMEKRIIGLIFALELG
jgi:hypothetical protein